MWLVGFVHPQKEQTAKKLGPKETSTHSQANSAKQKPIGGKLMQNVSFVNH